MIIQMLVLVIRVAKVAYSLDDAVAFKVSLEQLNESSNESYFIV